MKRGAPSAWDGRSRRSTATGTGPPRPGDGGLHGLRRPVRAQSSRRSDLPARRRRARRPDHDGAASPSGCWSRAGARRAWRRVDGSPAASRRRVTVRAPQVVVAAGALESPALLLRSGIGGPAAGEYLRLHPSPATLGDYGEDMQAWWGAPHSGLINEFANIERRLRVPDRGRAVHDRPRRLGACRGPGRAQHKQALRRLPGRRHLRRPHARPRARARDDRRARAWRCPWYAMTRPAWTCATPRTRSRCRSAPTSPPGARRVLACWPQGAPEWRVGDDLDGVHRARAADPAPRRGPAHVRRPPDGHLPHGPRPADERRRPTGELHDTPGRVDRRRLGVPHRPPAPTR